ncbi:MAG TPA: hypothetical protein VN025_11390 [Candidatus Dormibacteraeota bacterium]|nr:hypothetical protein [Candidatus Dormibacteraeota bacterium]
MAKAVVSAIIFIFFLGTTISAQEKLSYFRSVTAEESTYKGSITCIACDVAVRGDVSGEIVTIWGDVTVYGKVQKDIVAVGGAVHLKNGAEADGDVVAIGGQITTEGTVITPGKGGYTAIPWMHMPGQRSIGWRGAVALLGFHIVCVLLPALILRPRAIRSVAIASSRWVVTGLLGAAVVVAYSYGLSALDYYLNVSDLVEGILGFLFLAILGIGIAGIAFAIGDRFFPGLLFASSATGIAVLTILELIPYAGFVAMVLAASWATGAALWSGLGFRGPHPPKVPKAPSTLKLIS